MLYFPGQGIKILYNIEHPKSPIYICFNHMQTKHSIHTLKVGRLLREPLFQKCFSFEDIVIEQIIPNNSRSIHIQYYTISIAIDKGIPKGGIKTFLEICITAKKNSQSHIGCVNFVSVKIDIDDLGRYFVEMDKDLKTSNNKNNKSYDSPKIDPGPAGLGPLAKQSHK